MLRELFSRLILNVLNSGNAETFIAERTCLQDHILFVIKIAKTNKAHRYLAFTDNLWLEVSISKNPGDSDSDLDLFSVAISPKNHRIEAFW